MSAAMLASRSEVPLEALESTSVPAKVNPELAKGSFRQDYDLIIGEGLPERYGWMLMPYFEKLILYADFWARDEQGAKLDDYHLKLDLSYYKSWPPSAGFINPESRSFDPQKDQKWFPKLSSAPQNTEAQFHISRDLPSGNRQMICNSMTLEYYESGHNPNPEQRWNGERHNFGTTLSTIQLLLRKPYYGGRSG